MAIRVAKIDAAATVPVIELAVLEAPRCAALCELRLANAAEDGIELGVTDVEGVVVALELVLVVEKERERVVDAYRGAKWPSSDRDGRQKCAQKIAPLPSCRGQGRWFG
ncbi:MAG: hypothetical protein KGI99_04565 [Bradyrhizobium sp.]|uniref:hypothetical protein n=1 Tax=Bradyrhizobium sp. TaxID=376 RepID=UPI001C28422C|nr:hypothetical protein [Bradyrhizobium sp.]MBU6461347.1 hypothetical protein [Pseudomonadota bacterium]MDE2066522.1 hypothetical protein [Bradyrhizobium sp.]